MTIKLNLFSLLLLASAFSFSQVEEVNPPDYIKTITFKGDTPESQLPILKLGEYLVLEFDVLNGNEDDFYYTIEHYNYDWTPSVLVKNEYLDGFDNQRIRDYENSFNTYQIYSHYKLTIPNQFTRGLKKSGNYIINIHDDNGDIVFSRKFMLYEDLANVGVIIKRSRDVSNIQQMQSVDLVVTPKSMTFNNPKRTVNTVIIQNNNLNTAISNLKPQYTIGSQLIYKYTTESSFWAGNEYLYFENKDIRAASTGVRNIALENLYNSYLFTDILRHNRPYTYNPDINGNFLVQNIDAEDSSIEADYAWVHFSLAAEELPLGESVYVYGNFNNYALNETNLMTYNTINGNYEASLLLKQGFYNYKYVVLDTNKNLSEGAISGNFYQTENNYKVLIYYRELGARYDKIVGFGQANSVNITN